VGAAGATSLVWAKAGFGDLDRGCFRGAAAERNRDRGSLDLGPGPAHDGVEDGVGAQHFLARRRGFALRGSQIGGPGLLFGIDRVFVREA
jgi:hypothetical protein